MRVDKLLGIGYKTQVAVEMEGKAWQFAGQRRGLGIAAVLLATVLWVGGVKSQNWVQVSKIDSTPVYSVALHNGMLFAATADSVFKGTDGGNNWQAAAVPPGLTGELFRFFAHGAFLYIGTWNDGVFRTSDGGQSWEAYSTGLPAGAITGLTVLGDSIYAGTGGSGVYVRRLSSSTSWSAYNEGLSVFGVNSIGTSGNHLTAGIALYFYVRPQGGAQWTEVYLNSPPAQRLVHETLPLGSYLFSGTDDGIYRGDLNAQNWEKTDIAGLPNRDVEALAADGTRLYAGVRFNLEHFIWYTDDFGQNWNIQAHEFVELFDLFMTAGRLWAARLDGLWYLDISTDVKEPKSQLPTDFQLGQNYPNPFNPATTITFTLPASGQVELKVYDVLGRDVRRLVAGFKKAGTHSVRFDADGLPSGVYFYQLRAGKYESTKKMILTK